MNEFDQKAATWDDDPAKVERAKEIAVKIKDLFKGEHFSNALEYGSGTGLLGYELIDMFDQLCFMDESKEMTRIALEKSKGIKAKIIEVKQYDLLKDPLPKTRYDFIFTMLTMHHIDDTDMILEKFQALLHPGGLLLIIDLEKEDGSFHDGPFSGHLGFDKEDLEQRLKKHSLVPMEYKSIYTIKKKGSDNIEREYPLFISISRNEG